MVRLYLRMPRPLKNLDEVKTIFSHFERYGRLKEFMLHRDFFTHERNSTGNLTFVDESVANLLLEKQEQVIYFPVAPRQLPPSRSTSQSAPLSESQNGTFSDSRDPAIPKQEKFVIIIKKAGQTLPNSIAQRASKLMRTNVVTQTKINKHLLKGFEGYHGELTALWDQIGNDARERSVKMMATDRLGDEKSRESEKKWGSKEMGRREDAKSPGRGMEGISMREEEMAMALEKEMSGTGEVPGEVVDESTMDKIEPRLEKTVDAFLNDLRLQMGSIKNTVEDGKAKKV